MSAAAAGGLVRRGLVLLLVGGELALLVATSPDAAVADSSPIPVALWLDEDRPDQVIEVEYELRDEDGTGWATSVSLTLIGENALPPGDAVLWLYEVPPDLEVDRPPPVPPVAEVPLGGQASGGQASGGQGGAEVWLVDEEVWAQISLPVGHHTKRLLVHLDGSAELSLEGELLLRVNYAACPRVFGGCDEPTVRILEVW